MPSSAIPSNRIYVLVYKTNENWYGANGETQQLNCQHTFMGVWGINNFGKDVPVPSTTIPPLTASPGTSKQSANTLVQVAHVWVDPNYFGGTNFKMVAKVKDNTNNNVLYVDINSYNTNLPLCNFVPEPSACGAATELLANPIAATTATINYQIPTGAAGIEYVNNTSSSAPSGDGTYVDGGTKSVAITGLTTATTYHFWVRVICGQGIRSAWVSLTYTTS